jgi:aryl sulfotransferase
VHYNDLKANLPGEMRRIADFLGIAVPKRLWPELVGAAGFDALRRDGAALMGAGARMFRGGSERFSPVARSGGGTTCSRSASSPGMTPRCAPS